MGTFGEWLKSEINIRNISQKELADISGVTPAQISRAIGGSRGLGTDTLTAIARALRLPPEEVFRRAGILPPLPNKDLQDAEILERTSQMTPAQKRAVLAFINSLEAGDIQPAGESTNAVMGKTLLAKK
ncbi:MAG: helix-turn-helix transcriptional regulator [Anaerolineales bacterium]|jgi:transcriptional regulator with XRE-family HTH domain|nr:helix-turn-helix transcriptional regulator [Anaerolineales bacterium]